MTDREHIAELARQAAQGSREAFNDLYLLTRDRVYFVAFSITQNEQDALDILQESYLKAWQRMGGFQPPWEFMAWINQIAGNTAKNFVKQRKPHLFQTSGEDKADPLDLQEEKDSEYIPDAAMDTAETRSLIMEIIDGLPEDQRLCVLMYYYEDIPLKEIAAALEIPYSTVMSRMALARKKISGGVEALEKKGAKLYGAAPIPLLIWLLKNAASKSANLPPVILDGAAAAGAGGVAAGTTLPNAIAGVALPKIIAGLAAAIVVTGGTVTATLLLRKPPRPSDDITAAATAAAVSAESIPISNYLLPFLDETQTQPHTQNLPQSSYAPETQPAIAGVGTTAGASKTTAPTVTSGTTRTGKTTTKTSKPTIRTSASTTAATRTTTNPTSATTSTTTTATTTTTTTQPPAPQPISKSSNGVIVEYMSGTLPEGVVFEAIPGSGNYTSQIVNLEAETIVSQFLLRFTLNGSPVGGIAGKVTIRLPVPAAELQNAEVLEAQHLIAPSRMDDMSARYENGYLVFTTTYLP